MADHITRDRVLGIDLHVPLLIALFDVHNVAILDRLCFLGGKGGKAPPDLFERPVDLVFRDLFQRLHSHLYSTVFGKLNIGEDRERRGEHERTLCIK